MRNQKGFTLVELVAVILIASIMTTVFLVKLVDREPFQSEGYAGVVYHNLQYTRVLSVSLSERYRIVFSPSSYQIQNSAGAPISNPETGALTTSYPTGVTVTPTTTVIFDSLGKPHDGSSDALSSLLTLTVTSGTSTDTVTVTPETGLIE